MAKQTVSPVERHLEKGVLGLALLVLAGVVVKFLITSPNSIDLGGQVVGPGEVYRSMASDAERLQQTIRNKKTEIPVPPDRSKELVTLLESKPQPPIPTVVAYGLRVPDLADAKVEGGNLELVSVLPFGKPLVQMGRSGAELKPPGPVTEVPNDVRVVEIDAAYVVPVNWVTISATFNVDAQRQLAVAKKYLPGQAIPYLAGAELQRREKRWDGSFSDWETVKTYAPWVLPDLPFVEVEQKDGKPVIPDEMIAKVNAFRGILQQGWLRLQLMRPLGPRSGYGDWWDPPQFEGLDLLRMDDEVQNPPPDPPACPYIDRYAKKPRDKDPAKMTEKERQEWERKELARRISEVEAWRKQGCYEAASAGVKELLPFAEKVDPKRMDGLRKQDDELEALAAKAKREREDLTKGSAKPAARELLPQQVVWVHDALQNSVASGKTYQYRMRPLLFNNLGGQAMQLRDPKDAEIVFLPVEWSEPTVDVTIPSDAEFFLARGKAEDNSARVEIYRWHEGEWVRSTFDVEVGKPIGGRASVKTSKGGATPVRIDFSTGARVVDLRFDYPYRERKEKPKGGFDFGEAKPTLAMVYVDAAGDIHQRILEDDKRDPRSKELKDALAKPGAPPAP